MEGSARNPFELLTLVYEVAQRKEAGFNTGTLDNHLRVLYILYNARFT